VVLNDEAERPAPGRRTVVVPAGESVLTLVRKLSRRSLTVREEAEVMVQVKRLNPQIFIPDTIHPGTRAILPSCIGCTTGRGRTGG